MNHSYYIKTSLLFFFISPLFFATAQNSFSLQNLHWLAGNWIDKDSTFVENWKISNDFKMEGIVSPYQSHDVEILEHLQIIEKNGEIIYRALPFESGGSTDFTLTSAQAQEWIFENPEHDFLQKISYKKTGEHQIIITLTGDGNKVEVNYFRLQPEENTDD